MRRAAMWPCGRVALWPHSFVASRSLFYCQRPRRAGRTAHLELAALMRPLTPAGPSPAGGGLYCAASFSGNPWKAVHTRPRDPETPRPGSRILGAPGLSLVPWVLQARSLGTQPSVRIFSSPSYRAARQLSDPFLHLHFSALVDPGPGQDTARSLSSPRFLGPFRLLGSSRLLPGLIPCSSIKLADTLFHKLQLEAATPSRLC